jgi:hypothetical protein
VRKRIPNRPIGLTTWAELANSLNQLTLHRLDFIPIRGWTYTFSILDALARLGYISNFYAVERIPQVIFRVSLRFSAGVPVATSFRAIGAGNKDRPVLITNLDSIWQSSRYGRSELLGFAKHPSGWSNSIVGLSELKTLRNDDKLGLFSAHLEVAYV